MSLAASDNGSSLELGRFAAVVRRRWWAVVVGVLIGILGAAAVLVGTTREATATTLVNVNVISSQPFNGNRPDSDLLDAQTETSLARSSKVVSAVSDRLGDLSPQQVRAASSAVLLPTGTVLRIQFKAPTPRLAERGADALAEEYLSYRSQLAQDKVDAVVKQLTSRRKDLSAELATIQQQLAVTSAPTSRARLQAQSQVANTSLSAITQQLTAFQALDTGGGTILTSAHEGSTVVSPRTWVVVASGVLGGLLLGLVLAFLVDIGDRRVRDEHDVEGAGGGAVLARLPRGGGRLHPHDEEADAVRSLRERLLATLPGPRPVVALADISGQSIPANIATNLAVASAHIGMRVHLVLPEHSSGYVSRLVDVLDLVPVESGHELPLMRSRHYPDVSVTVPSTEMYADDNSADQVIELLRDKDQQDFDLTLVALPMSSSRSLRLAVGRTGHAFVLVVAERQTTLKEVAATAAELRAVNAVIHGTVMVARGRRFRRRSRELKRLQKTPRTPRSARTSGTRPPTGESAGAQDVHSTSRS